MVGGDAHKNVGSSSMHKKASVKRKRIIDVHTKLEGQVILFSNNCSSLSKKINKCKLNNDICQLDIIIS